MDITALKIKNTSDKDLLVYLTLGSYPEGHVQDVNGIFGISSDNPLQGSFTLTPNEKLEYTCPAELALSGNFAFGTPPLNCPTDQFPDGINLFEFTLNNAKTGTGEQETVDISCVAGANCLVRASLAGGGKWNASPLHPDVAEFENSEVYDNHGRVGVYPYGCDGCTEIKSPPECPDHPAYALPQEHPICNVQRPAEDAGGFVFVEFVEYFG